MKLPLMIAVAIGLVVSHAALAITGTEFVKLEITNHEKPVLDSIIVQYVSRGYKNVPSWARLSSKCKELILKNGYGNRSLDDIADEAAVALGMMK